MSKDSTSNPSVGIGTPGVATVSEGENTPELFRGMPNIPIDYALEQASVMIGCVHKLTFIGVMDKEDTLVWAAYLLSGMARSLVEDVALSLSYSRDDSVSTKQTTGNDLASASETDPGSISA